MRASPYRTRVPGRNSFEAAWRDLKRRRNLVLVLAAGLVPGTLLAGVIARVANPGFRLAQSVAVLWALAVVIAYFRMMLFRCPNCGREFFVTARQGLVIRLPLSTRCANCEIEIGAPQAPNKDRTT